ncbi:MAG: SHOCT domain-containing protein [Halobacteriales archaeon]
MTDGDSLVKLAVIALVVVFVLPALMMAFAMPAMGVWVDGHMWNGMGRVGAWVLIWIGLLLALVVIGVVLVRAMGSGEESDAALEELRVAYARGDLTTEEFEERRRQLEEA